MIKPKDRVLTALRGGCSDKVPFTIYESKIPQSEVEREMRNNGLCIINRQVPVFRTLTPNVKTKKETYFENGKTLTKTWYETPVGTVSRLEEAAGFTSWQHEKLFKSVDDYKTILFMIEDERYVPTYEQFVDAEKRGGGDFVFRAGFGLEPMQSLISGVIMDMQTWCIEWMDNRDEVEKLYQAQVEKRRERYPIVADSPALHANYGGNVTPEIIGLETFNEYYIQHYNEACEVMHKKGKLVGCHFDGNCMLLSESIAKTDLDYIEAFTPAPDTDMTLRDAREAWPNKALWLNFPSSVHLKPDKEVADTTVSLLNELNSMDGIIMGITEDIPQERWQNSCKAIMDGLERHSCENQGLYKVGL